MNNRTVKNGLKEKKVTITLDNGRPMVDREPAYAEIGVEEVRWQAAFHFKIVFLGKSPFSWDQRPTGGYAQVVHSGSPQPGSGGGRAYKYAVVCRNPNKRGGILLLDPIVKPTP
jgi:hypothetical protein